MSEKKLRHPVPAGPREVVGYKPSKKPGETGDAILGQRPYKECEHLCVHCGAPLKEAS